MKKQVLCNVSIGTAKWRSSVNSRRWVHGFSWWIKTAHGTVGQFGTGRHLSRAAARQSALASAAALGFTVTRRKIREAI